MSSSSSSSSSSSAKSDSSLSHNSHLPTEQQKLLKEIKKGGTQQRKLKRASDMLKGDKKFMLAAVRMNEKSLRFLSEELKHDFDFMLAAVKVKGMALEWGSTTMRTDKVRFPPSPRGPLIFFFSPPPPPLQLFCAPQLFFCSG